MNSTGDKTGAANLPNPDTERQMTYGGNQPNTPHQAEQVLTKDELLRILADKGVIPDYMIDDSRTSIDSGEIHNRNKHFQSDGHPEDVTQIVWDKGILKEVRAPAIVLYSGREVSDVIDAEFREVPAKMLPAEVIEKEEVVEESKDEEFTSLDEALKFLVQKENDVLSLHRNIHGEPISEREVVRGNKVTAKTIHDELERWRKHPILSKYSLSVEEEKKLLETLNASVRHS